MCWPPSTRQGRPLRHPLSARTSCSHIRSVRCDALCHRGSGRLAVPSETHRRRLDVVHRNDPPPRDRPRALPQLRRLGHHEPRAPRPARRPQAGAAAHPVRDVRAPAPDRRGAPAQERHDRRRGDGKATPARRHGDLRRARADGAGLLAPRAARRRAGQLRLDRRRQPGGDALHGGPADAARRRTARAKSSARPSPSGPRSTARCRSRSCCRRASPTCSSTARRASQSAWRRTSRRTTSAR